MFDRLIVITPLGLLYGSSGSFLSPENLVGRSGNRFPPSSATVSGLFATVPDLEIKTLRIAGPFWAKNENPQNFFVPTPFNCLVEQGTTTITYRLSWQTEEKQWLPIQKTQWEEYKETLKKWRGGTWLPIQEYSDPTTVYQSPWKYLPHLHPRLEDGQRRVQVEEDRDQGSLFLENAVQVDPDACLIYLTNQSLPDGWYRFGGEGHLVDVQCHPITDPKVKQILEKDVGKCFALITPAVWGSNRLSYRSPQSPEWEKEALLTDRPITYRYRLGGEGTTKRLSRGRYAVPPGTVYVLKAPITKPWFKWDEAWFPKEGYSFQRWGSGLALPL